MDTVWASVPWSSRIFSGGSTITLFHSFCGRPTTIHSEWLSDKICDQHLFKRALTFSLITWYPFFKKKRSWNNHRKQIKSPYLREQKEVKSVEENSTHLNQAGQEQEQGQGQGQGQVDCFLSLSSNWIKMGMTCRNKPTIRYMVAFASLLIFINTS